MKLKYIDNLPYDIKYKIFREFINDYFKETKIIKEINVLSHINIFKNIDYIFRKYNLINKPLLLIKVQEKIKPSSFVSKCLKNYCERL